MAKKKRVAKKVPKKTTKRKRATKKKVVKKKVPKKTLAQQLAEANKTIRDLRCLLDYKRGEAERKQEGFQELESRIRIQKSEMERIRDVMNQEHFHNLRLEKQLEKLKKALKNAVAVLK